MNPIPDVEALFEFSGTRQRPIYSGYRPMHLIFDNYLTTGIHEYYNKEYILPNESILGTITFITPEAYPRSCWPGKKIPIQEGERIVGYATVTKVFNPILRA